MSARLIRGDEACSDSVPAGPDITMQMQIRIRMRIQIQIQIQILRFRFRFGSDSDARRRADCRGRRSEAECANRPQCTRRGRTYEVPPRSIAEINRRDASPWWGIVPPERAEGAEIHYCFPLKTPYWPRPSLSLSRSHSKGDPRLAGHVLWSAASL